MISKVQPKGCTVRITLGLAFVSLFTAPCLALDPTQPVTGYLRTAFTQADGLATDIVNQVVQTRDGFLWLASPTLLTRFDGQHFTVIPLPSDTPAPAYPRALAESPDGDLWIGTKIGLRRIPRTELNQSGPFTTAVYHSGSGMSDNIVCLQFGSDGVLWVGTKQGLFRLDHGAFSTVIPTLFISRIERTANGHLLIVTGRGFVEWDGTHIMEDPELPARLGVPANRIYHVFEDRSGARWFCTGAGVARQTGNSILRFAPYQAHRSPEAYRAFQDSLGNVWVAMAAGLFRATATRLEPVELGIDAKDALVDHDGDLWVATNGKGLIRYKDRVVRMFTAADGLPNDVTLAVFAASDGKLWVGNNCGGLSWFDGHRFRTYSEKDGLTNSCVYAIAEDRNKDLWVGTYGGGVFRFHDGRFTQFSKAQGLRDDVVRAIVPAPDGSLWIATHDGLAHLSGGHVRNYTTTDGLPGNIIVSIYLDRQGVMWVGSTDGLSRQEGDRFVTVVKTDALSYRLLGEDVFGRLYSGLADKGMFRIERSGPRKNSVIGVTAQPTVVTSMLPSAPDSWLIGDGIWRISAESLQRWEHAPEGPRDYTEFDHADGLSAEECSDDSPAVARTSDGRLWVATFQGVAMFDVARLPHDKRKPSIYMEQVTVGKTSQTPGRELAVAPGTHHVELHYGAIELRSPEKIHFQYRMDGVDQEWLEGNATSTAIYTFFPNGTHQFHLRACNRDGVWDRVGIAYNITQQPFFYETNLFRAAIAGTVLFIMAGIYQLRLRQMAGQMNARFDARMEERTRLAGELHDTLVQTIHAGKMVAEHALVGFEDDAGDPRTGALVRISGWLAQALQEARASLQALHSSATETNDLAAAFRDAGEQCVLNHSIRFHFSVEGKVIDMHPIVRDEVYRIGYEAVRNACNHSGGSLVEMELSYGHDLVLRVRDNGKGMDAQIAARGRTGHFGLNGMRERAARIGGKLSLVSAANSGTRVELIVPGALIFRSLNSARDDVS